MNEIHFIEIRNEFEKLENINSLMKPSLREG